MLDISCLLFVCTGCFAGARFCKYYSNLLIRLYVAQHIIIIISVLLFIIKILIEFNSMCTLIDILILQHYPCIGGLVICFVIFFFIWQQVKSFNQKMWSEMQECSFMSYARWRLGT